MRERDGLTIVKLGGSQALSAELGFWLAAIAERRGAVVLVPGGGPFADAVRAAQIQMGFDDAAAHHMALLAMEQFGCGLASLNAKFVLADSTSAIRRQLGRGLVPIWAASKMVLSAQQIPCTWDVTSDSLSAWLAGTIGAERLVLLKSVKPATNPISAAELAVQGIVDAAFPGFLAASGTQACVACAGERDQAAAVLAGRSQGIRIGLH